MPWIGMAAWPCPTTMALPLPGQILWTPRLTMVGPSPVTARTYLSAAGTRMWVTPTMAVRHSPRWKTSPLLPMVMTMSVSLWLLTPTSTPTTQSTPPWLTPTTTTASTSGSLAPIPSYGTGLMLNPTTIPAWYSTGPVPPTPTPALRPAAFSTPAPQRGGETSLATVITVNATTMMLTVMTCAGTAAWPAV